MEVQLRILESCVVAKNPIINFARTARQTVFLVQQKPEPRGQDELALNIISTCRTYREEAWKLFWQRNMFVNTHPESYLYMLQTAMYLPPFSGTMRHLSLRSPFDDTHQYDSIWAMLDVLFDICRAHKNLEIVEAHFVTPSVKMGPMIRDTDVLNYQLGALLRRMRSLHHRMETPTHVSILGTPLGNGFPGIGTQSPLHRGNSNLGGNLKKMIITGLPEDDLQLQVFIMRFLFRKLGSQGLVGYTVGKQNQHYYSEHRTYYVSLKKPELIWITANESEEWIDEHGEKKLPPSSISGLVDWNKLGLDKNDSFFRAWA